MKLVNNEVIHLDGYGWDNAIIKKAATTCYASQDKTQKTGNDFVKHFLKINHGTPLEFIWFPVALKINLKKIDNYVVENNDDIDNDNDLLNLLTSEISNILMLVQGSNYLEITITQYENEFVNIVISGNGRAWLDFLTVEIPSVSILFTTVYSLLHEVNEYLFPFDENNKYDEIIKLNNDHNKLLQFIETELLTPEQVLSQGEEEFINIHHWHAFELLNVSRGFTAESNRHRVNSINEMSTRYVTISDIPFVISEEYKDDEVVTKEIQNIVTSIEESYNKLLSLTDRDNARQILPLGTAVNQIVATRHMYWNNYIHLRTSKRAHWEIQDVANEISYLIHENITDPEHYKNKN